MAKKSSAQLDDEIAEALSPGSPGSSMVTSGEGLRVGQLFDRFGDIYEVTKIGRDKKRTIQIAMRIRDLFGKEHLINQRSFPARDVDREYLTPLDSKTAARRGWPELVK